MKIKNCPNVKSSPNSKLKSITWFTVLQYHVHLFTPLKSLIWVELSCPRPGVTKPSQSYNKKIRMSCIMSNKQKNDRNISVVGSKWFPARNSNNCKQSMHAMSTKYLSMYAASALEFDLSYHYIHGSSIIKHQEDN